jgi:hypothetical protein
MDFKTIIFSQSKVIGLASNPQIQDQVPVLISPVTVVQLYPQALGSLFVTFYNSQGYGADILTCLHMDFFDAFP